MSATKSLKALRQSKGGLLLYEKGDGKADTHKAKGVVLADKNITQKDPAGRVHKCLARNREKQKLGARKAAWNKRK